MIHTYFTATNSNKTNENFTEFPLHMITRIDYSISWKSATAGWLEMNKLYSNPICVIKRTDKWPDQTIWSSEKCVSILSKLKTLKWLVSQKWEIWLCFSLMRRTEIWWPSTCHRNILSIRFHQIKHTQTPDESRTFIVNGKDMIKSNERRIYFENYQRVDL